jgi:ABC-type sugar transport system ATPase subunit
MKIESGSFTTILGPPGAGKTTLLRLLTGVEIPDGGKIFFDGKDVTEMAAKDRNVAMVFQSFALHPGKTVFENIASPLKIKKVPDDDVRKRVKATADMLGIGDLMNRHPKELSGGQQQRVTIARAMVKDTNLIFFDEPLTNLDYKIRESMRGELKKIFTTMGKTLVYATPDVQDALSMAKKVAVLNKGNLEQYGTVDEILKYPANTFVGYYFSFPPMNLLDGVAKRVNGKLMLSSYGLDVDISDYQENIKEGEELVLGIRPSQLLQVEGDDIITFEAEVIITEVIGSETIIHLQYQQARLAMHVPTIYRLLPGDKFKAGFRPQNAFIFRKADGKLIKR